MLLRTVAVGVAMRDYRSARSADHRGNRVRLLGRLRGWQADQPIGLIEGQYHVFGHIE